ncbi:hypothetical protein GBAR_LOCUS7055 [Geodia barretti]|uniref:Uncharacterized protein n=1 Tax=Geodia barretti TaxID=519541 RepID=A0AA35WES0_GEOBA|nr:hypothetical protein GBAR_LOCUS7055 [Geodia barretti]
MRPFWWVYGGTCRRVSLIGRCAVLQHRDDRRSRLYRALDSHLWEMASGQGVWCGATVWACQRPARPVTGYRGSRIYPLPFFLMLPYVLTLLVLAGFVGQARPPAALALPYRRE